MEKITRQMEEECGMARSAAMADMRYTFIRRLCHQTVIKPKESKERIRSQKLDSFLTGKWTAIAIGYMCALAYCAALVVYQLGGLITGEVGFNFFTIVAAVVLVAFIYLMVRPNKYLGDNEVKIDVTKI